MFFQKLKRKISIALTAMTEGRFFSLFFTYFKKNILSLPDKTLGAFCRFLLSLRTPIDESEILFTTFQGDYTCNPKAITEELLRQDKNYKIVWGVRKTSYNNPNLFPENIKLVERAKFPFYKEWCRAKVIVVNSVDTYVRYMPKKKGQFLIQTWHGSLGIKRFGKDPNWTLLSAAKKMAKKTDFIISNSAFEDLVYRDTFWANTPIWQLGHARNDILYNISGQKEARAEVAEKVKHYFKLDGTERLVLYAPTFRNALNTNCYNIDPEPLIQTLHKRFGGNWKILVRLHPTARKVAQNAALLNRDADYLLNATSYPDIQDLMVVADAFITDYSSCIYDYVLTRRPGFIYATDISQYNNERGFYYPLEQTPFPISTNNKELLKNIENFDENLYLKKIDQFLLEKGCIDDGHASERIAEKIAQIMGK